MSQTIASDLKIAITIPAQLKRRLRFDSFAVRLFAMIMGGAVISIAALAFLFAETVKYQTEDQIQKVLEAKVGTINEMADRAENLADSLNISVSTLHERKAETPETFQVLTRELFEKHPRYMVGLGFGQKENGILPSQEWFYPYYQINSSVEAEATPLSVDSLQAMAQPKSIRYVNRAEAPNFYPTSEAYRTYFLPQKSLWTAPYQTDRGTLLTYYSQIFNSQNEWLGTAVIDIDAAYLKAVLNRPVYRQGGKLFLLAEDGRVIANPSAPDEVTEEVLDQTYADVPGLTEIWPQVRGETSSDLLEGENGYWSYLQIPDQSWVVLAYVPYWVVFGRIVALSLSAMVLAGLIMAGVTALAVRYLNRRLRPVIDECQRLSIADETVTEKLAGKDELAQLSISFFNLLDQLHLSQTQVRLEAAHATEVEGQLQQIQERTNANQRRQRQITQKLAKVLPLVADRQVALSDDGSISSAEQLQQELAQLNEVVSTLAEDNWLVDTLSDRRDEPLPATELSELNRISDRLGHTFVRVLSVLDQFSSLLSAFGETYEHVLTVEKEMLSANRDMELQAAVIEQLQQWREGHEVLCNQMMHSTHESSEQEITAQVSRFRDRQALIVPTIKTFRQTTQQLSERMRSLFSAIENINQHNRQYQQINSVAQVLITNASTLSISASRQQNPEAFEDIRSQFRSKNADLQALVQRLETVHTEQQLNTVHIQELAVELRTGLEAFEQVAETLNDLAESELSAQPQPELSSALAAKYLPPSEHTQQLTRQLSSLRNSLQEIESLTLTVAQYVSTALNKTHQIHQIKADVPLAISPREY